MNLSACSNLPTQPETGTWYRAIQQKYFSTAQHTNHTKLFATRFNAGRVAQPQYEVLYLAQDQIVALFEIQALFGSQINNHIIPNPAVTPVIMPVEVVLQRIVDLTEWGNEPILETSLQELTGEWRAYASLSANRFITTAPTQLLGAALYAEPGIEGFRTPSARIPFATNIVIFPDKLLPGSYYRYILNNP